MMTNSFQRWLTGRYALSWQLSLSLIANYFLTGFFFGETEAAATGVTNHEIDFVTGATAAVFVFAASFLKSKVKVSQLWFVQIVFLFSTAASLGLTIYARTQNGLHVENIDVLISGFLQMFAVHNILAIIVSSLMETRSERRRLAIQRSKLTATKNSFEQQISEIDSRLKNVIEEKLTPLLNRLSDAISMQNSESPDSLANQISDALNEGVRPLSWDIERSEVGNQSDTKIKIQRISLRERLNFKIRFEQFVGIKFLSVIYIFFEIPVMYFYFDARAAVQTTFVILFTALMLWGLKTFTKKFLVRSWIAVTLYTILVAITSFTFVVYRQLTNELAPGVPEIALVLSMVQIAFLSAIFQSSIVRRLAYIGAQKEVNRELEQLVSQLRQRAWVAKKNLARLVHGQVQSELFAAYLQLSQANQASALLYQQVGVRLEKAKAALLQPAASTQNFGATLEQIVATWGSSFKVNTDISGKALAALDQDPVATACAVEIVLEAINNAAKYGSNGQASLVVNLTNDLNLYIEVTNGADSGGASSAGYGSTVLDDVTHEWNLEITDGIAKLTALVMLEKPA